MSVINKFHVIETDFEPDDALAILAHAKVSVDIDLIVVLGESKPNKKMPEFIAFINAVRNKYPTAYSTVKVFQGIGSNKDYPFDENIGDINIPPEDSLDTILQNYRNIYALRPVYSFMMKPPREAVTLKLECPDTVVFCYGSFNWRTLKLDTSEYMDLTKKYRSFYYYDSFTAIGPQNSGMYNPKIIDEVSSKITSLIGRWNRHILDECIKNSSSITDPAAIERNNKIIKNIKENIDRQFVMADVCLFLCDRPTEEVELVSMNPYPQWRSVSGSEVYVFDSNTEIRRQKLMDNLEKLVE